jgi:solute carrier family 35 (UDP-galactose transporter), member B1
MFATRMRNQPEAVVSAMETFSNADSTGDHVAGGGGDIETAPLIATGAAGVDTPPMPRSNLHGSELSSPSKHHFKQGSASCGKDLSDPIKLIVGAGGIYGAFLYYGSLQEDVFRYSSPVDGTQFKQAWFLQVVEAAANVLVGYVGMKLEGSVHSYTKNMKMFAISGASQVTSKACTSLALANGLSFPVATLAKSGKMAPVMLGSLLLGGASYTVREYLQVLAIIAGTAIVSMGKKKSSGIDSSMLGVMYIALALLFDGITAGTQKRMQNDVNKIKPKPYEFMFGTNLFMCLTALLVALLLGEITSGLAFCEHNPEIMSKIVQFSICSAVGQSFIFYTLANFDPLILTTVTTTRKIFSVLLSIFFKGNSLSLMGWSGVNLACFGIAAEMQDKMGRSGKKKATKVDSIE